MLDFLKTAAGGYNYLLIISLMAWIVSTLGVVAGFHKHRSDTVTAQTAARQAQQEKEGEEHLRKQAEARLAAAEQEILTLKPKPLPDRLLTFGNGIDRTFQDLIRGGMRTFRMNLDAAQFGQLQSFAKEDSRLSVTTSTNTRIGPSGPIIEATLQIGDGIFP